MQRAQRQSPGTHGIPRWLLSPGLKLSACRAGAQTCVDTCWHRAWHELLGAGYRIPKGTALATSMYAMHRDPSLWAQAEAFLPERFLPGAEAAGLAPPKDAWQGFRDGPRSCPG